MIAELIGAVLVIIWAMIPLIYGIMSWWWFISSVVMIIIGIVVIYTQFKPRTFI